MAKTNFDNSVSSLNKIAVNRTKKSIKNEIKKLKTLDLSCFIGKSHFEEDGPQNYLVFQSLKKYFKVITKTDYVSSLKSKGLSPETNKPPSTSDNSLTSVVSYYSTKTRKKNYWKLFKTTKNLIHSWKNSKQLHCL